MFDVAVVGATGAVGGTMLRVLEERGFPVSELRPLASERSAGRELDYLGQPRTVRMLTEDSFEGIDIALFSAGGSRARDFAPAAVAAGAVVIDNSSAFRMDPSVPLVVPEVNPQAIARHNGIIANPNCSTIIMNVPVWPLHQAVGVRRVVVSTYQAASGAGAAAMAELEQQARDWNAGRPLTQAIFKRQYLWNLFSHNSKIDPATGYNEEETKMVKETRKIFGTEAIRVTATCVRVPVLRAHSESINLTFAKPLSESEARQILSSAPGVRVVDDRLANKHPEPIDASGGDDVLVGRIRRDLSQDDGYGLDLFVSGDQLRKGAALNAIQIAELLLEKVAV